MKSTKIFVGIAVLAVMGVAAAQATPSPTPHEFNCTSHDQCPETANGDPQFCSKAWMTNSPNTCETCNIYSDCNATANASVFDQPFDGICPSKCDPAMFTTTRGPTYSLSCGLGVLSGSDSLPDGCPCIHYRGSVFTANGEYDTGGEYCSGGCCGSTVGSTADGKNYGLCESCCGTVCIVLIVIGVCCCCGCCCGVFFYFSKNRGQAPNQQQSPQTQFTGMVVAAPPPAYSAPTHAV